MNSPAPKTKKCNNGSRRNLMNTSQVVYFPGVYQMGEV
jgi:hypothetical protein